MQYVWFFGIMALMVLLLLLLSQWEKRIKRNYQKQAYHLLEQDSPDPKRVKKSIRSLRLYQGRLRPDEEVRELILRLQSKLERYPDIG